MAIKFKIFGGSPIELEKDLNEFVAKIGDSNFIDIKVVEIASYLHCVVIYEA